MSVIIIFVVAHSLSLSRRRREQKREQKRTEESVQKKKKKKKNKNKIATKACVNCMCVRVYFRVFFSSFCFICFCWRIFLLTKKNF